MIGQTLGKYRIVEQLGAGGMGVVYRAVDQKLDREVAIKLVPQHLLTDGEARRRFQQEARTLSRLNHPNIAVLYEFDQDAGVEFLAMELVRGQSLRTKLAAGALPLKELCRLGAQLASGLAAAHEVGIVHRDLKPENVIVTVQEQVKILDFGVAGRTAAAVASAGTATAAWLTQEHTVSGTLPYMAPEQLRGEQPDPRSDIYSAGVVLYEMATGQHPFARESGALLVDAVLNRDPAAPSEVKPGLQPALDAVVLKAMDKQPERRYQSVRELAVDLERMSTPGRATTTVAVAPPKPHRVRSVATWTLAAAVLLGGAYFASTRLRQASPPRVEYVQLTHFTDSANSPALAPDGKMLTFLRGESTFYGPADVYVKLLPDGEPVQLTHDNTDKSNPRFAHDSQVTYDGPSDPAGTWVVSTLGGQAPRHFMANAVALTWFDAAPGQRRLLFSEFTGRGAQLGIITATESRAERRVVYMPPAPFGMAHRSAISPDRKHVLVSAEMDVANWLPCRLVPFAGGSAGRLVGPRPSQCTHAAWSPDGKWMYFTANIGSGFHIWRQQFPDGKPEQITFGTTEEEGVDFGPDGRSFVTAIGSRQSTIWIHDERGERQITSEGYGLLPTFSPDGKKLYYMRKASAIGSFVSGSFWLADLETGERRRLLPDFLIQTYEISPDGKRVVFVQAGDTAASPVWLAPLDGSSPPRRLADKPALNAFFLRSGKVLLLTREGVYLVREDGSALRKTALADGIVSVSPDGEWMGTWQMPGLLVAKPVNGGPPVVISRAPPLPGTFESAPWPPGVSWSRDGKFIYLKLNTTSTYAIPLRPGQMIPAIAKSGFQTEQEIAAYPGARPVADRPNVFPGPNPGRYAFTRVATQRNIYRVLLP